MSESLQRRIGLGIVLQCDDVDGVNFTNIGAVVDGFEHSGAKADMVDASILTDIWKRFAKASIDGGEITLMLAFDPRANTSYTRCCTLLAITGMDVGTNFKLLYPAVATDNSSHSESCLAYVAQIGRKLKKAELTVATVTLKIDGNPHMGNAA